MNITDINNRLGDLTQELSLQFVAELISAISDEQALLGLIHEIAESPDK